MQETDNYKKHTASNFLQKYLINNFFKELINEVEKLKPYSILDAGCGEGFTLDILKNRKIGKKLTGFDFLEEAIGIGKKLHPELNLLTGDIYNISFKDNSFDLVICTEVLEHLENPEKALKELRRVTKEYVLISVPNEPFFMAANFLRGKNISRWGNDIEHIQHWSRAGIKNLAGKYFEVKVVKNPFPWTLLIGKK